MKVKIPLRKIIGLTLLVLLVGLQMLEAQTPASKSPANGFLPEWSADSQLFVYQNLGKNFPQETPTGSDVLMGAPYWEALNPQTGEWHESNVWPLYPDLTETEKNIFQIEGFTRTSPDRNILIYASSDGKLIVANRSTREVLKTDIDYSSDEVLPVWWSENGQGVAIEGSGESPYVSEPIVYYIRLQDQLNQSQVQIFLVRRSQPMVVESRVFTPIDNEPIFDVHQNQVLTTMSDLTNLGNSDLMSREAQTHLVIWNPENPDASVIIDAFNGQSVDSAAFVPDNPQQLLVILSNEQVGGRLAIQEGLYVYDLQTHNLEYVTAFDGYYSSDALFSPDGKWLALVSKESYIFAFFRTSDLLAMKPLGMPTLFPTFTPYPTYTPEPIETATPAK